MKNKIDWKNHLIGFVATIIGIIIGLNLDERQKTNETQERLESFKKLLHEEIILNISKLDTFINNSNKHELHLKFLVSKNIDNNIVNCTQAQLDSVTKVWFPSPFIINSDRIADNRYRIYFALSTFDYISQNTVWEAFKNTDLVNNLDATEITKFTRLYKDFEQYEKEILADNEKITHLINSRRSDKVLSSLSLKDYLRQLIDLMFHNNLNADQGLIGIKNEMGMVHQTKYPEVNSIELFKKSKESFK